MLYGEWKYVTQLSTADNQVNSTFSSKKKNENLHWLWLSAVKKKTGNASKGLE